METSPQSVGIKICECCTTCSCLHWCAEGVSAPSQSRRGAAEPTQWYRGAWTHKQVVYLLLFSETKVKLLLYFSSFLRCREPVVRLVGIGIGASRKSPRRGSTEMSTDTLLDNPLRKQTW